MSVFRKKCGFSNTLNIYTKQISLKSFNFLRLPQKTSTLRTDREFGATILEHSF